MYITNECFAEQLGHSNEDETEEMRIKAKAEEKITECTRGSWWKKNRMKKAQDDEDQGGRGRRRKHKRNKAKAEEKQEDDGIRGSW